MAEFSVKTDRAKIQADDEQKLINELSKLEDRIRSVSGSLSFEIAAKANIRSRLNNAANRVDAHRGGMSNMHSALTGVIRNYESTEQRITGNAKADVTRKQDGKNPGGGKSGIEINDWKDFVLFPIDGIIDVNLIPGVPSPSILPIIWDAIMDGKEIKEAIEEAIENAKDTIIDKSSFEAEAKVDGALYKNEISCENGSLGVSVSAYEAYASAEGGLFSKDDDGNLIFDPKVAAKVGASYTLLNVAGEYAVGNDMLGAGVSGDVTVGKVSGQVEAEASLMGEDGSFNPHAKLEASAEAILVDAKAQAGVTVLGTEAKVEGSVNIGVGAHANFEVGDGKIACDIGASLGIGASVKFSIDYGGTVDAVKKGCKSVLKKLKFW